MNKSLVLIGCFVLGLSIGCVQDASAQENGQPKTSKAATSSPRPNIILINLDDADVELFSDDILARYLPTFGSVAKQGMSFTNCHVSTPLCGPSRACLLRGQYAHRTGIKTNTVSGSMNNGFSGGYQLFLSKGYESEHIGAWMNDAGYRTMMIGKYQHGRVIPERVKGWDDLHICFGGTYYGTVRYSTRYPVGERRVKPDKELYRTSLEAEEAVWMIEQHAQRIKAQQEQAQASDDQTAEQPQPFFLYHCPLAPHKPSVGSAMLEKEIAELAKDIRLPNAPDLNEVDVSDKPKHLQLARFTKEAVEKMHEEHRQRLVTLISVDNLLKRVIQTLEENLLLENTYIMLTSDHGYQLGHNRMIAKKMPFHRSTVVPLFVVGPGVKAGSSANHIVSNIDFAPTVLAIAGATDPIEFDGKSFLPILQNADSVDEISFRPALLIENWEEKSQIGFSTPATYSSQRTASTIYTEWANGEREFYDLVSDPYQLENRYDQLSDQIQTGLSKELHGLKSGVDLPLATIATQGMIKRTPALKGFAEDVDGVARVGVTVQNKANSEFFDGESWSSEIKSIPAKLQNQNGLISGWELDVDLAGVENGGSVEVSVIAKNLAGRLSEPTSLSFAVDSIDPSTELRLPKNDSEIESPVMVFGVCDDNHEISGIELMLKNVTENKYWNGQSWVANETKFIKRLRDHRRWHIEVEIPAGEYRVWAGAMDSAGNVDPRPDESHFFVK